MKRDVRSAEINRLDTLLAKWGVHVGGAHRTARRKLATRLEKNLERGWLTDQVLERLSKEAEVRSMHNPAAWIASLLEDDVELQSFVRRVREDVNRRKGLPDPGHGADLGEDARRAAIAGRTLGEFQQRERELRIAYCWIYEEYALARIAEVFEVTEDEAEEMLDKGVLELTGQTVGDYENARAERQRERREERKREADDKAQRAREGMHVLDQPTDDDIKRSRASTAKRHENNYKGDETAQQNRAEPNPQPGLDDDSLDAFFTTD